MQRRSSEGGFIQHEHKGVHDAGQHGPTSGEVKGSHHHDHQAHGEHMIADFQRRFWVSLVFTIPVLILSPLIQDFLGFTLTFPGDSYLLFLLSSIIFWYGGYPFLKGLIDELRQRNPGMMTLIGVAILTAYIYSGAVVFGLPGAAFFWELATLVDIMLLGHWIEMRSVMGASRALEALAQLLPQAAHRLLPSGEVEEVPLEEIEAGDRLLVKPGEKIPADGVVVEGQTEVNESLLTGESKPVEKKVQAQVIGGSINGSGSITVEVQKTGSDSFISQVINLVREAQASKSHTQNLADRAAFWLTIIALSAGAVTFLLWLTVGREALAFSLERAVTVMVITCPHALGLAIPLVVAVSTSLSAQKGLLIRNRQAFENARRLKAVIFDKTGTLTQGKFGVTDVISLSGQAEETLLTLAASVESLSEHPIAQGIVEKAKKTRPAEDFLARAGRGVEARVDGKKVEVVSLGYLEERGVEVNHPGLDELFEQGKTVVFILIEGKLEGAIALADVIRPESREAVAQLKARGIKCLMLTGDNQKVARWVAQEVGLDDFFAQVLPQEKSARVQEVQRRGLLTAMVGDGVNDAPALAQADVGIAIGAGTDVAVETADIVLVQNNPQAVVSILNLAQATYRKMIQNLFWATGYNAVAIPLAAGVLYPFGILLSPAVGAVLMSLSTVIVAVNAQLLKVGNNA